MEKVTTVWRVDPQFVSEKPLPYESVETLPFDEARPLLNRKSINSTHTKSGSNKGLSALAREILDYLQRHPESCDSLTGVAQWWLLRQRLETASAKVQQALNELVAAELVERERRNDGAVVYRLSRPNLKHNDIRKDNL